MDKIKELVEWVAKKIAPRWDCLGCEYQRKDAPHCNGSTQPNEACQYQFDQAKQILSHPDLYGKIGEKYYSIREALNENVQQVQGRKGTQ